MPPHRPLDREYLLSRRKVDPETGCWLWTGALNAHGYGSICCLGAKSVHRVAYEIFVGPIPPKGHVLHRCDVRNCMNPQHLYIGDHTQNMRDRERRGRVKHARGEECYNAKLTEVDVKAIRHDKRLHKVIAAEYSIVTSLVSLIKAGKAWKHVTL